MNYPNCGCPTLRGFQEVGNLNLILGIPKQSRSLPEDRDWCARGIAVVNTFAAILSRNRTRSAILERIAFDRALRISVWGTSVVGDFVAVKASRFNQDQ
jgi:hypothetical protein